ncbi:MAG TPA: DUF3857 domain-containing protein [Chitinophagaceae bacterium]|nr:DUF3857 domain-containing protein [Chitinophagaceae bacterium]HPG12274.1 DUF3857 domain-containing protein [Chitinophagaceae bacterium]
MRNKGIILFLFSFISLQLLAGEGEYAVSKIPKSLIKNANAVLRLEEVRLHIVNTGQTVITNHYVITILNENGDRWSDFYEYYNKFREVESVEGFLYDAYGNQIKKIKKKDIEDISGVSDNNLIDDTRYKRHNFYYRNYPYTVEYISEVKNKGTLFFPNWFPQAGERLSVEKSTMRVICDQDYQFRYKAFHYNEPPKISYENGDKITTWVKTELPAIVRESYSPLWHDIAAGVILGPSDFEVQGYKGNMATWQDFGKFVYTLKQGRDQLPDDVKQTIHQIADGVKDPAEKISKLYKYMQDNTRYISIQLGIGGWQPFDATYVASKKYGDCKALTNYMYSLLKEAGINSYYTLVRAGDYDNYITDDFPSQQFNHVILCVPLEKDSMWLECTSQTLSAGYLSGFTSDRYVLLIDEQGGKLVRTPKYGIKENIQLRKIEAKLDAEGALQIKATNHYTGLQQDDIHGLVNHLSKDKVKKILHEELDFATYDVNEFNYQEQGSSLPFINESLDISAWNYATITGKRLFIIPNVMTRTSRKLSYDSTRKYDIILHTEYEDVDSVTIELPGKYDKESMPKPVDIDTKFGHYTCSVNLADNKLYYYRNFRSYSGRFPAKDYSELVDFYNAIYKADRSRVVLVKKETEKKGF